jgi:hypothetical protein
MNGLQLLILDRVLGKLLYGRPEFLKTFFCDMIPMSGMLDDFILGHFHQIFQCETRSVISSFFMPLGKRQVRGKILQGGAPKLFSDLIAYILDQVAFV